MEIFEQQLVLYERVQSKLSDGVFLWGAGTNGGWCLDFCYRTGLDVKGFIDSNAFSGQKIMGVPVLNPEEYRKNYMGCVVLITAKHKAKEILIHNTDIPLIMSFDAWFYIQNKQNYDSLVFYDEESYTVLEQIKKYMISSEPEELYSIATHNQYFELAPFFNTGNEIFVDLGAYVGDTIERFVCAHNGAFIHIYGFEPGERQYSALESRMDRLKKEWALDETKITLINKGVGRSTTKKYLNDTDHLLGMQIVDSGNREIEVVSIDDFFEDKKVTFIKSDIEGDEYEMLLGAKDTIQRCRPKLAVSVYHRPDDLLNIYALIAEYSKTYRFSLRNHSSLLMDTTLYCY